MEPVSIRDSMFSNTSNGIVYNRENNSFGHNKNNSQINESYNFVDPNVTIEKELNELIIKRVSLY